MSAGPIDVDPRPSPDADGTQASAGEVHEISAFLARDAEAQIAAWVASPSARADEVGGMVARLEQHAREAGREDQVRELLALLRRMLEGSASVWCDASLREGLVWRRLRACARAALR